MWKGIVAWLQDAAPTPPPPPAQPPPPPPPPPPTHHSDASATAAPAAAATAAAAARAAAAPTPPVSTQGGPSSSARGATSSVTAGSSTPSSRPASPSVTPTAVSSKRNSKRNSAVFTAFRSPSRSNSLSAVIPASSAPTNDDNAPSVGVAKHPPPPPVNHYVDGSSSSSKPHPAAVVNTSLLQSELLRAQSAAASVTLTDLLLDDPPEDDFADASVRTTPSAATSSLTEDSTSPSSSSDAGARVLMENVRTPSEIKTAVLSETPKTLAELFGKSSGETSPAAAEAVPAAAPLPGDPWSSSDSPARSTRTASPQRSALAGLPHVPPGVNPYDLVIDATTNLRTRRYDHLNLQSASRGFYHVDDRDDAMLSDWSDRIMKIRDSGRGPTIQSLYALSHMRFKDAVLSRELRVISDALFRMGWSDAEYYHRDALLAVLEETINYLDYQQSEAAASATSDLPYDSEQLFRTLRRVCDSVREESSVELDTLLVVEMMAEIPDVRRNLWGIDQIIECVEVALKDIFERYLMFVSSRLGRIYDDVPSRARESFSAASSQYLHRASSSLSLSRNPSLSMPAPDSPIEPYGSFFSSKSSSGPPSASGSSVYGDSGSIRGRPGFSLARSARSFSAGVKSLFGSRGSTPDPS
ncbi:hypothetical protein DFJ73DRAFT_777424 [Zopfochytrium polystomum]|nr:hypothetical protein DFJ73DRAFT_777424 [Zopfochytrium polystomum]